jgi:hypothetical protein
MITKKEKNSNLLLPINLALGFYGFGVVCMVQLSAYPLWAYVGLNEIQAYHNAWWQSIWGPILFPAGMEFVGSVLMIRWRPKYVSTRAVWLGVILQIAWVVGTAIWWAPLMMSLGSVRGEFSAIQYGELLTTHWIRVGLLTGYAILIFWMAAKSWIKPMEPEERSPPATSDQQ